ncbi:MAG: hypothetical protein JWM11_530 [Planctomycetaceae bacterium]|nr:hypothetical protein [Planctomycetaceae bacterium]
MTKTFATTLVLLFVLGGTIPATAFAEELGRAPTETKLSGPDGLPVIVRMQGPYDADVPLQIVCYFKRTDSSDERMAGAPVELDKRLGGVIGAFRSRGDFSGEALETLLIEVPATTIKAKRLLLIGLGDEQSLSRDLMERVGRTALRESARLGSEVVAFAPLIKDQGNDSIPAGEVERAVIRGVLLAYDTEMRMQKQGLSKAFTLKRWIVEAGPKYYDETVAGVDRAIEDAAKTVKTRDPKPYSSTTK